MNSADGGISPQQAGGQPDPRRWLVLGVIAVAQLMIVLDLTIMNIARQDLRFSVADRQWVVTAPALAFGSLLLGGKLADLLALAGWRRVIVIFVSGSPARRTPGPIRWKAVSP